MKLRGVAVSLVGLLALAAVVSRATLATFSTPVDLSRAAISGSASCRACHAPHVASWQRTFHRTMTQMAAPGAVLGDFDDAQFTFDGVTSRFTHEGPQYFIETLDPDGSLKRFRVERTVGSRRFQQYLTRDDDHFVRLPLAWNIGERRWFHLNGGFLDPDGADFNTHRTTWDANCIFCHNVKPRPGYDWSTRRFDSSVGELGIACEACHAPGSAHVSLNSNPLRRYVLNVTRQQDRSIISPTRLEPLRQVQVCGHCHGQRMPDPTSRIRQFLTDGDPYTPGDDLSALTQPLHANTSLPGVDVQARFWRDGTPRLSAYEYQALTMTPDFHQGGLTCLSCHSMHAGDPRGMLDPSKRTNEACRSCHSAIVDDPARHSGHTTQGTGADCYGCHLPRITYGLLAAHPTHRIQRPDATRAWRFDMPEACTLCHLDRSAQWAAQAQRQRRTELGAQVAPLDAPAGFEWAESVRSLAQGDVVQRVIAAIALGDERSALAPADRLWEIPFLLDAMTDSYAAVRAVSYRSLLSVVSRVPGLPPWPDERFEPQAAADQRMQEVARWQRWWRSIDKSGLRHSGEVPLDAQFEVRTEVMQRLKAARIERVVSIGE